MNNFEPIGIKIPRFLVGTLKNGIQLRYLGHSYLKIREKMRRENPLAYNELLARVAVGKSPSSEIVKYIDADGNFRSALNVGAGYISGTEEYNKYISYSGVIYDYLEEETKLELLEYLKIRCNKLISNTLIKVTEEDILKHLKKEINIFSLIDYILYPVKNSPQEIYLGDNIWKLDTISFKYFIKLPIKISDFYIHLISMDLWNSMMDNLLYPVVLTRVEYPEYIDFKTKLSKVTGLSYQLPTEKLWELIPESVKNNLYHPILIGLYDQHKCEEYHIDENPAYGLTYSIGNGHEEIYLILVSLEVI